MHDEVALATTRPAAKGDLAAERDLVERARTDRSAFAELYRLHVDAVYGVAFRRCGSREVAEEATSATFERALRSLPSFQWRAGGMRPWLLRIASNEVAEVYRSRSRGSGARGQRATSEMAAAAVSVGTDAVDATDPLDLAGLHAALDRLSERYRAVISLRYLAGMSADAAAAELGCSKPALAVTLHRALGALRAEMARTITEGGAP